jgi:Tol biopolymer transport system component
MQTEELRELKPNLGYFTFSRWSPDGRELLVQGRDPRGRNRGLYRIDVRTGGTTLVASPGGATSPQWAADGKHVYFLRRGSLTERHLVSGVEREVVRIPEPGAWGVAVSPDERHIAYATGEEPGPQDILVMPVAGGASRAVLRVAAPELLLGFHWTADGAALAVAKRFEQDGPRELWLVPANSGKPRKLDIDVTRGSSRTASDSIARENR